MTVCVDDRKELDALEELYDLNFKEFAADNLKIQTMEGELLPYRINEIQHLLDKIIQDIRNNKRLVRLVILKARREGVSTYFTARFYWKTTRNMNRYTMVITHEPEATDFLFSMYKRYQAHNQFKPEEKYNSKKELEFNNKQGTGLDSAIHVGTAGKEDLGSAQLIHHLHLCLHPDTPILVEHGRERKISDICIGEQLITHNGQIGKVYAITRKTKDELPDGDKAIVIHPWLGNPVIMTPQHKVFTNMGWVEAGNLDPNWHFLSMPIRNISRKILSLDVDNKHRDRKVVKGNGVGRIGPDQFPLNEETGYFIGYYLAEGNLGGKTPNGYARITFALHEDEEAYAMRAYRAVSQFCKSEPEIKTRKGTKTKTVRLNSISLASVIDRYFGRVDGKHIPDWVFDAGEDFCRGLVAGYLYGSKTFGGRHQGYVSNAISATSIRESITYQIRDIVASLGYGWGGVRRRDGGIFYGRNCKEQWTVYFSGECGMKLRQIAGIASEPLTSKKVKGAQRYRMDNQNGKVWIKIKKLSETICPEFYDIEINHTDHSFRTAHFAVSNSEVPKWPRSTQSALLTSVLQCVPDDPETEVAFEGTAKGIGGEFYTRFWGSRYQYEIYLDEHGEIGFRCTINESADPNNIYSSVFIPWFVFKKYEMDAPEGFKRTTEEQQLAELYNLTDRKLQWRRYTIANKCNSKDSDTLFKKPEDIFAQEYPSNPTEAFLASGKTIFDVQQILQRKKVAPQPIARYELLLSTGQWITDKEGRLRVWQEPRPGHPYIVAADVAEGLESGDYDSADVISQYTGQQVAQWHGHLDPDQYALLLYFLGHRYNKAWMVPERNNHGYMVCDRLEKMKYPRLYVERIIEPPHKPRLRYGWVTAGQGRHAKNLVIDNLVGEVRDKQDGIVCADTFSEMVTFKQNADGSLGAELGYFDDRVMSIAIAKYVRTILPKVKPIVKSEDGVSPLATSQPAVSVSAFT